MFVHAGWKLTVINSIWDWVYFICNVCLTKRPTISNGKNNLVQVGMIFWAWYTNTSDILYPSQIAILLLYYFLVVCSVKLCKNDLWRSMTASSSPSPVPFQSRHACAFILNGAASQNRSHCLMWYFNFPRDYMAIACYDIYCVCIYYKYMYNTYVHVNHLSLL